MSDERPHLEIGQVATDVDQRLGNLVRAWQYDPTDAGDTVRWLLANLIHARAGLHRIADDTCFYGAGAPCVPGSPGECQVCIADRALRILGED